MITVMVGSAISGDSPRSGTNGSTAAKDPGVRGGTATAAKPLPTLSAAELVPYLRQTAPGCDTLAQPEDTTNLRTGSPSDIVNFAMFMRLRAPPLPLLLTAM
jgi:hypothetical protein